MSIDKDDARLTAYALGQMEAKDRDAFEKELADDPAAQCEVAAIRAMAARVGATLEGEPAQALAAAQRRAIERAAGVRAPWRYGWVAAAAACLLAVVFAYGSSTMLGFGESAVDKAMARQGEYYNDGRDGDYRGRVENLYREPADALSPIPQEPPAPPQKLRLAEHFDRSSHEPVRPPGFNTEAYDRIVDNDWKRVADADTSTFSVDVDTASYANVRRFLNEGKLPPKDAVRIEELINYFPYDYAAPEPNAAHPFVAHVEVAGCPWSSRHRLARIGLKGKSLNVKDRPPTNLVFLVDVSGSMRPRNKLPLLKQSMQMLVSELDEGDRVAVVVYAGAAGLVLRSTTCDQRETIQQALERLQSGGSTNGGEGIRLAYDLARKNFLKGGVNRVILATDGDFNVGVTDRGSLTRLIEENAKTGVFLTILGFGTGNLKDARMEELSNKGNGNYAYIDSLEEAQKVLVDGLGGTLVAIAKDVKIQIFFNPKEVAGYRLIGYANRMLEKEDFNDDTKDAGDIGAGHAVTALYELVPAGQEVPAGNVDQNPFVAQNKPSDLADTGTLFLLRLRYKQPDSDTSTLMEQSVMDRDRGFDDASPDFRWASAVAAFGMLLRDSPHKGQVTWETVLELAKTHAGADSIRQEFLGLVEKARRLAPTPPSEPRQAVEGRLDSVRGNLVVISLGSADGVRVGDLFHVRRGSAYVGQVRIDVVKRNLSVGTFDSRLPGPGAPPQKADVVYRDKGLVEKDGLAPEPAPGPRRAVEGCLNSVRDDLVVISLGSADGVRVGDLFHVRRGSAYVGRIRIDKVERNLSVGTFDSQFPGPGAPPQKRDVVYRDK
ncbi:MAG: YfbK domain-containing protein [Planctomycetota bacterium]|jgi:Ca-activated chloride channel family protein